MNYAVEFPQEPASNSLRAAGAATEPAALKTYTPTQAVLARSSGIFHWTPEDRRLYDFSSGVLVANLGHNPRRWWQRVADNLGWNPAEWSGDSDFVSAAPLTAYNALTEVEVHASSRLIESLSGSPGGGRLDSLLWAASGSEAIQKALWCCLHAKPERDIIVATRYGFHGKKGLAGAVTGCEEDHDRDPRVKFISFPMEEVDDITKLDSPVDLSRFEKELAELASQFGNRLNCLITEPYLGGGGSFHPPASYLQLLQAFCRKHDMPFILDEVQSNFGRTGTMYAYESYGLEPDIVCLGKGLGNGVPVSAAAGRADLFSSLTYGEASDTWSANPLACAAVLATLDEFADGSVLANTREVAGIFRDGLLRLKELPSIANVRGEGLVYGVECCENGGRSADEVANDIVATSYLGDESGQGIHLLGPLAKKVLRVSPPNIITPAQSRESLNLLYALIDKATQSE